MRAGREASLKLLRALLAARGLTVANTSHILGKEQSFSSQLAEVGGLDSSRHKSGGWTGGKCSGE